LKPPSAARAAIPCGSAEMLNIADSLADDAVRCKRLSASNSLIIRENIGNFPDFGRLASDLRPNWSCLLSGFDRNSLPNRTGNCFGGARIFFDVTENFQNRAGKFIWQARAGAKTLCF
jgi:hypothetical protein